jgi:hypothetical protein
MEKAALLADDSSDATGAVEIDARMIQGAGGEVRWQLEDGGHVVTVTDVDGKLQARFRVADGRQARELYEHPFALADVPNVFERELTTA